MLIAGGVPVSGRDVLKSLIRFFLRPPFLVMFGAIALSPLWIPATIYTILRSIEATGSAGIAWAILCIMSVTSLFFWVRFFRSSSKRGKILKELRSRSANGDQNARD